MERVGVLKDILGMRIQKIGIVYQKKHQKKNVVERINILMEKEIV